MNQFVCVYVPAILLDIFPKFKPRCFKNTLYMHCDVTSMIFACYAKRTWTRRKQNNKLFYITYNFFK